MPNQRGVNETELVVDVNIAFQPSDRVLELHWNEYVGEGMEVNNTALTYRDTCTWDRKDTREAGIR